MWFDKCLLFDLKYDRNKRRKTSKTVNKEHETLCFGLVQSHYERIWKALESKSKTDYKNVLFNRVSILELMITVGRPRKIRVEQKSSCPELETYTSCRER